MNRDDYLEALGWILDLIEACCQNGGAPLEDWHKLGLVITRLCALPVDRPEAFQ
jgi:hypothetical protein